MCVPAARVEEPRGFGARLSWKRNKKQCAVWMVPPLTPRRSGQSPSARTGSASDSGVFYRTRMETFTASNRAGMVRLRAQLSKCRHHEVVWLGTLNTFVTGRGAAFFFERGNVFGDGAVRGRSTPIGAALVRPLRDGMQVGRWSGWRSARASLRGASGQQAVHCTSRSRRRD